MNDKVTPPTMDTIQLSLITPLSLALIITDLKNAALSPSAIVNVTVPLSMPVS